MNGDHGQARRSIRHRPIDSDPDLVWWHGWSHDPRLVEVLMLFGNIAANDEVREVRIAKGAREESMAIRVGILRKDRT